MARRAIRGSIRRWPRSRPWASPPRPGPGPQSRASRRDPGRRVGPDLSCGFQLRSPRVLILPLSSRVLIVCCRTLRYPYVARHAIRDRARSRHQPRRYASLLRSGYRTLFRWRSIRRSSLGRCCFCRVCFVGRSPSRFNIDRHIATCRFRRSQCGHGAISQKEIRDYSNHNHDAP
jgi:hypothetical protein